MKRTKEAQAELRQYMSDLSEEAYFAGWMQGLEYALWEAVLGERQEYGRLRLSVRQIARLRALSERCDGWIIFDAENGETWVPMAEWQQRFSAWRQKDEE